ncbi:TIGR00153 family protein [bacterium]|nr:TIGR00153 family protein [candidate division CSSED10-310 bacterium]
MLFDKKARKVEKLMRDQFERIGNVLEELILLLEHYCANCKDFKRESLEVHKMEHKADKIRREIGRMLYNGAFLPVYREDYFYLVELVDEIANKAEDIGDFVTLTRPPIPSFAIDGFLKIARKNIKSFELLQEMLDRFLSGDTDIVDTGVRIQELESSIDKMQFDLIRSIFKSSMDKYDKMHAKQFIDEVCAISDLVEDVSDQFEIVAAKHRL